MEDRACPLDPRDANAVIQRYRRRISEHGLTLASLCSGDAEKQIVRYEVHASALRGEAPEVLDIGCGLAGFLRFLRAQTRPCVYTGYDILPEYVRECCSRHPKSRFEMRNALCDGIDGIYDTIVMSQVLNNRYQYSDNIAVMSTMLSLAYAHTRVSVSVDMMSNYVDYEDPALFYYSPEDIFRIAKQISKRVVLRFDYRPFEFCIQLYHDDVGGFAQ